VALLRMRLSTLSSRRAFGALNKLLGAPARAETSGFLIQPLES
jgi:hypothetical protein